MKPATAILICFCQYDN